MTNEAKEPSEPEVPTVGWTTFLESTPPTAMVRLDDPLTGGEAPTTRGIVSNIEPKDIQLHCDVCGGPRTFFTGTTVQPIKGQLVNVFVAYTCRNCRRSARTYSVRLYWRTDGPVLALKFGEIPVFGPPVPSRVISLIGPDRELFLRGRRVENQGLGIGAFAYYRRVVENQKSRLIEEVGKVASKLGAKPDVLALFEKAAAETQFKTAIDLVKDAIPQALLINGHNPLQLLHTALSEGLHELPDEECLQLAESIRVVLSELAERISIALKDEAELKSAVTTLLNRKKRLASPEAES